MESNKFFERLDEIYDKFTTDIDDDQKLVIPKIDYKREVCSFKIINIKKILQEVLNRNEKHFLKFISNKTESVCARINPKHLSDGIIINKKLGVKEFESLLELYIEKCVFCKMCKKFNRKSTVKLKDKTWIFSCRNCQSKYTVPT